MTDFAFVGKKGTGKSKNAVRVIRDHYFVDNRIVATNLDLFLEPMFGPYSKKSYIRVPDKPTEFDLRAAGHGNADSYNEDLNGALVLDELGTWFNSRSFADKGRAGVLDFFAHARKRGWDCIYIMQNVIQVDKQLRESYIEYTVRHVNFKKVMIPLFGSIIKVLFGHKRGYLPPFHTATTRVGYNPQDLKTDFVTFRGLDIEPCYDTRQEFTLDYPHGTHSVLSPWHLKGRFLKGQSSTWGQKMLAFFQSMFAKPKAIPLKPKSRAMDLISRLPCPDERLRWAVRYSASLKTKELAYK